MNKLLTRDAFREAVRARNNARCCVPDCADYACCRSNDIAFLLRGVNLDGWRGVCQESSLIEHRHHV